MIKRINLSKTAELTSVVQESPMGPLHLYFTPSGLTALTYAGEEGLFGPEARQPAAPSMAAPVLKELTAYFAGTRTDFSSLTLDLRGTDFQLRVWQELRKIPWGTTIPYKELAARVGSPKACRAAGQANGCNPIPIIIPCHRVIAADGSLGGYRSGLDRKRWLLQHENAI